MKIRKILISQPQPKTEKSPYFDMAKRYNVKMDFVPLIRVEPILAKEFRTQKIDVLSYTAIIFNSRHGIDHFFRLAEELRLSIPETTKYFCASEAVAYYLQKYIQYRKRKVFYSPTGKFGDLVEIFNKNINEKFLFITSNIKNEDSISVLESTSIKFDQAVMYKTVSCQLDKDEPFDYDMLLLFSPAGVTSLYENFPDFDQQETKIGCLGKKTAQAIAEKGLRLDLQAPTVACPSIIMALDTFLKENQKSVKN